MERGALFDPGDAIQIVTSDSFDDQPPTGCIDPAQSVHGQSVQDCAETLLTWNQMRPALFDGGYAFASYYPGGMNSGSAEETLPTGIYIVETVPPPGYALVKEEDKNVDFGDQYAIHTLSSMLPPTPIPFPLCVGDLRTVPAVMSKDGSTPAPFAGDIRPLCDKKEVILSAAQNAVADFHLFTPVPKTGRIVGQITNPFANATNPNDPNFGGPLAPSWIPLSIQDATGNEIARVYSDEWGAFSTLVPSTHSVHIPSPSGVSPNVVTVCANHPGPIDDGTGTMVTDPNYNPNFDQPCLPIDILPGKTSYLPVFLGAIAAFTGSSSTSADCEFINGTPVIKEVNGPGLGGPYVDLTLGSRTLTLTSAGDVTIPNPDYDETVPGSPLMITRDYGFGPNTGGTGSVTFGGTSLAITHWDNLTIIAEVPAVPATGELIVTRAIADNGLPTIMGVTLTVDNGTLNVVRVPSGGKIQDAIDLAPPHSLVLIPPGEYPESLLMWKPLQLQGHGAYSTKVDADRTRIDLTVWQNLLNTLVTNGNVDLVPGQRADLAQEDGAGITVLGKATGPNIYTASPRARIDGLTITGATWGSGIFVNGYASYLQISNSRIVGNHGSFGGGIRVGWPHLVNDISTGYYGASNSDLKVHHNHITQNGSPGDGGGLSIYKGADHYAVTENLFCGNYSALNGGAISHFGLSHEGVIADNRLLLNEAFGEGGAIAVTGQFVPADAPRGFLTEGAGSIRINANLIQSNIVGDDGGGISLFSASGQDVATNPGDRELWFRFDIINNIIVNNLSGFSAGGISLSDTTNIYIVNNTIAHNDSTATAAAFAGGGLTTTNPMGAGIVARGNNPDLAALTGETAVNPVLVNNIIRHNRSFYWDAALNGGLGGLMPNTIDPYWDLEVFGVPGATLHPQYCLLSDTIDPHSGVNYNIAGGGNLAADPQFVNPYLNIIHVAPGANALANFPTFTPLKPAGDYHFMNRSPAKDAGDPGVFGSFKTGLSEDPDNDARPNGPGVDMGADEIPQAAGPTDSTGPTTWNLSAAPNPTHGAASITVTATTYDTGTGGSTIAAAEWWTGTDPGTGLGNTIAPADGTFDAVEETLTTAVPVPGGNFTVFVRSKDSRNNWGLPVSVEVQETTSVPTDTTGPSIANLSATPNPTQGEPGVTITATAFDTFSGGSTITAAEWWIGTDLGPGSNTAMMPSDGTFDAVEENLTTLVPIPFGDFTLFVRSRDSHNNWGDPGSVLVRVTAAGSGSGNGIFVQCPGDSDGNAVIDAATDPLAGDPGPYAFPSNARCMHLAAGDGFVNMADGRRLYIFSFSDVTGIPPDRIMSEGMLAANFPAPRITLDEGDEFYLNLTNVGMKIRPDLFDPHTVHWHGFPEAASIFDGVPEASISINMGSILTYYYNVLSPGTYMYHCHVEATEHMQMGMLGSLYVRPKQNRLEDNYCFATARVESPGQCSGHQHSNPDWNVDRNLDNPLIGDKYAYNDGDGSTYYDVEFPIQIGSFDPVFHDASENVQPLPFADMKDVYPMLNGRGYPDTTNPDTLWNTADVPLPSQKENALIEAVQGQTILLRISNLNVTRFYTLSTLGISMKVIGKDAKLLRGPSSNGGITPGRNLYYRTNSVTLGGGESVDVLLDTRNISPGTYFLYTSNLNYLSNNEEDYGGMMTEMIVHP